MPGGSKLAVHGGTESIRNLSREEEEKYKEGLKNSLLAGQSVLVAEDGAVASVAAAMMATIPGKVLYLQPLGQMILRLY